MFSVKVSQGNSLEKGEMFSHMLSSNPTETLPVKFLEELSFNSISLALVSFFFPGSKTKSSKCSDLPSFLNVKNQQVLQIKLCRTKNAITMGLSPRQLENLPTRALISLWKCIILLWLETWYKSGESIWGVWHSYVFGRVQRSIRWCIEIPNLWQVHIKKGGINCWIYQIKASLELYFCYCSDIYQVFCLPFQCLP